MAVNLRARRRSLSTVYNLIERQFAFLIATAIPIKLLRSSGVTQMNALHIFHDT